MRVVVQLVLLAIAAATKTHAFDRRTLREITRDALENFVVELDFTGDTTFTNSAIRTIVRATASLDRSREGCVIEIAFGASTTKNFSVQVRD